MAGWRATLCCRSLRRIYMPKRGSEDRRNRSHRGSTCGLRQNSRRCRGSRRCRSHRQTRSVDGDGPPVPKGFVPQSNVLHVRCRRAPLLLRCVYVHPVWYFRWCCLEATCRHREVGGWHLRNPGDEIDSFFYHRGWIPAVG